MPRKLETMKWVCLFLLLQARLLGLPIPREGASNPASDNRVTHCWTGLSAAHTEANFDPILNAENIAGFVGAQASQCKEIIDSIMNSYKDRPLSKQMLRIVLGIRHDTTFSVDSEVGQMLSGHYLPYTHSAIIGKFRKIPNPALPTDEELFSEASALWRHEGILHAFYKLYKERNKTEIFSSAYINKSLAEYQKSIKALKEIEILYQKSAQGIRLSSQERKHLTEARKKADEGAIDEMKMFDALGFILHRVRVMETLLKNYPDPGLQVEEAFAHIWHLFPEKHIEYFFPYHHQTMLDKIATFDPDELQPLNAPPLDANYSYAELTLQNTRLSEVYGQAYKELNGKVNTFSNNIQTAVKQKSGPEAALEIINFYNRPGMKAATYTLGYKEQVKMRLSLALAYYLQNDYHQSYQNFNAAMKVHNSHNQATWAFNDQELNIFKEVAAQLNKPINNGAIQRHLRK